MKALKYLKDLVAFDSISSQSNVEVSEYVEHVLRELHFETEWIEYEDAAGVRKASVVARRGHGIGGMAYFGHTDVVPADDWRPEEHGPFEPTEVDGRLYGRGSCDMKGSVAAMLDAASRFADRHLGRPLYIVSTADEEIGYGGALAVVSRSQLYREIVAGDVYAVVGEPTRLDVVHAHKGTYGFSAVSHGRAAHSSTLEGVNANLAMIPFLVEMRSIHDELMSDASWRNDEFDPPIVSWNIGVNDHTRAVNITPPQSICTVYFRPMPGQDAGKLLERARTAAEHHGLEFRVERCFDGVYTPPRSPLIRETLALAGRDRSRTVAYGTDGAVLRELKQLVVCGPGDIAQAHTNDEWIELEQLELGADLYARMIQRWCIDAAAPPEPPPVLRAANAGDLPQIETLIEPFVAQRKLLPRSREELARLLPHGFVAERAGRIIGFAAIEIYSSKLAEIQCLAVAADTQRQGIGRRLVEQCVNRAKEHRVHELMAITAADELFKECGFDYSLPDQKKALFIHPVKSDLTTPDGPG